MAIVWLGLSIAGAILYKWGGSSSGNTKYRDLGVPFCQIALILAFLGLKQPFWGWISFLVSYCLSFASLTSYYKKNDENAQWWNWLLVGLINGLAFLPFAIVTQNWIGFIARTVTCAFLVMAWSEKISNAFWEEFGRGFILTSSIPLLLI